jgi:hypothetical protein
MAFINYHNLSDFLDTLPSGPVTSVEEESLSPKEPDSWVNMGTLKDDRLNPSYYSYKLWSDYALGFYPFNDCDMYRDENDRILFSYIEYGGHAPFRRSFVVNKNSPVIYEPVGFKIRVNQAHHDAFFASIAEWGLTKSRINAELKAFEKVRNLNGEHLKNSYHVLDRHALTNEHQFIYTMTAPREQAVKITNQFDEGANKRA